MNTSVIIHNNDPLLSKNIKRRPKARLQNGNRRESRSGSDRCANCGMEEDESELRPTTGYVDGIKVITVPGTDSSKPRQYKIPPCIDFDELSVADVLNWKKDDHINIINEIIKYNNIDIATFPRPSEGHTEPKDIAADAKSPENDIENESSPSDLPVSEASTNIFDMRKFKRCSRCCRTTYCCRDCQISHWKTHKKVCTTLQQRIDKVISILTDKQKHMRDNVMDVDTDDECSGSNSSPQKERPISDNMWLSEFIADTFSFGEAKKINIVDLFYDHLPPDVKELGLVTKKAHDFGTLIKAIFQLSIENLTRLAQRYRESIAKHKKGEKNAVTLTLGWFLDFLETAVGRKTLASTLMKRENVKDTTLRFAVGDRVLCHFGCDRPSSGGSPANNSNNNNNNSNSNSNGDSSDSSLSNFYNKQKMSDRPYAYEWVPGTIIKLWWRDPGWPIELVAPYQIRIDIKSEAGYDKIFAPQDTDSCVRRLDLSKADTNGKMVVAGSSDDENEEQEIIFDPVELEPVFETVDWNNNQSAVEYALNLCSHQPVKAAQLLSQIFLFNFTMQDCDEASVLKSQAVALGKIVDASLTPANIVELEKRAGTHQRKEFTRRKLIASNIVKFEHRMKIVLPQCIALHQTLPLALPQCHALSWKILAIVFKRFEKISKENVSQTVGLIPSYLACVDEAIKRANSANKVLPDSAKKILQIIKSIWLSYARGMEGIPDDADITHFKWESDEDIIDTYTKMEDIKRMQKYSNGLKKGRWRDGGAISVGMWLTYEEAVSACLIKTGNIITDLVVPNL